MNLKRLLSLLISLGLLAVILWRVDFARVAAVFAASRPGWLALSLLLAAPITVITAWRFQLLMPPGVRVGFGEANRLILAASVLNLVLPSKLGDLSKAFFLRDRGGVAPALGLALVVFEKGCDMLALLAWCVYGLLTYPDKGPLLWLALAGVGGGLAAGLAIVGSASAARTFFGAAGAVAPRKVGDKLRGFAAAWEEVRRFLAARPGRWAGFGAVSVGLWFLHLAQIWLFTVALREAVPFGANLGLAPLAILAGLLPLTFAGVGTRDAALVFFYAPWMPAPAAAALGLLCTTRYLLPAAAGLPLLPRYLLARRAGGLSGSTPAAAADAVDRVPSAAAVLPRRP